MGVLERGNFLSFSVSPCHPPQTQRFGICLNQPGNKPNGRHGIKNATKIYIDVHAKRPLEIHTHLPSLLRIVLVVFVGKWDLGSVVRWQESHLVNHASQTSGRVCPSREPEEADLVAFVVCLHQVLVRVLDVHAETAADGHVEGCIDAVGETAAIVGPDAGLIVCHWEGRCYVSGRLMTVYD